MRHPSLVILDAAMQYEPSHVFALFSGGHDSLCSTAITAMHPRFSGAVHINTTIGIEETRQFVIDSCKREGWPLKEYFPPVSYEDICKKHGMPGPGAHLYCYTRLKERCIQQLTREHKTHLHDRIVLSTGVRRSESVRRMGHVMQIKREGVRVWVAPIIDWSDDDKNAFMIQRKLIRNPVVDAINMSGECLCGAFSRNGELSLIAENFPQTADKIRAIEAACRDRGVHSIWGARPPKARSPKNMELCFSCEAKR